jgi:hypothetical protein
VVPFYAAIEASRQCSSCNAGLYAVFDDVAAGLFSECRLCPAGADCPALSNVSVSPAFYGVRDATTWAVQTFPCEGARCAANLACGPNRAPAEENPLCGRCQTEHSEWGGSCVECTSVNGGLVFGALLFAWVCVLALHALSQSASNTSALRITMYFWQVAFLIVGPAAWVRWATFLDLDFLAATGSGGVCPFPVSPSGMAVLLLLGPLLPFALLAATAMCASALRAARTRWRRSSEAASGRLRRGMRAFWAGSFRRTAIALYFFTFNRVTRQCLDFFHCTALPAGRYVTTLPGLRCDSPAYRAIAPLAGSLLVAYLGIAPGLLVWRLRIVHAQARDGVADSARVWSVVYGPFREAVFWWGLAQMLLRAALVAVTVYVRTDAGTRFGLLTLISVAAVVLLLLLRPNQRASDNAWELATYLALTLLATSMSMGAPDPWLAFVTLSVGAATVARLCVSAAPSLAARLRSELGRAGAGSELEPGDGGDGDPDGASGDGADLSYVAMMGQPPTQALLDGRSAGSEEVRD